MNQGSRRLDIAARGNNSCAAVWLALGQADLARVEIRLMPTSTSSQEKSERCDAQDVPPNAAVEPPRDQVSSARQAHNEMARLLRARVDV
jgi:hypothetical protein